MIQICQGCSNEILVFDIVENCAHLTPPHFKFLKAALSCRLLHSPPFSMGLVSMGLTCMMLVNYGL